ncbi:MAG TPA: 3-dehydroquinate synthase [Bryobacteraceae bacterium]|nr:3-dehydroquinate synthase [Bryobacteraceae bacterium]
MPSYVVNTPQRKYEAIVQRGILARAGEYIPASHGKVFVVTTRDVWDYHCSRLAPALARRSHEIVFFPGGEENKRLAAVEALAEEMVRRGADRSSLVIAFGGGVVGDVAGFTAAVFMRGIPVLQIPTTLLAQVDASIGGKTGVDLVAGKNLVGAFHQPVAVLIDPEVLGTLAEREYRAGLFEVVKCGVIRSPELFSLLEERSADVLARKPEVVDRIIAESVRIKAEVVTADERESGVRAILNFGHTAGHALEAETGYSRFLHGEAVAFGMRAAVYLAERTGRLSAEDSVSILNTVKLYGPIPPLEGVSAEALVRRALMDKKTVQGRVRWVLPERIGEVAIVSDIDAAIVRSCIEEAIG